MNTMIALFQHSTYGPRLGKFCRLVARPIKIITFGTFRQLTWLSIISPTRWHSGFRATYVITWLVNQIADCIVLISALRLRLCTFSYLIIGASRLALIHQIPIESELSDRVEKKIIHPNPIAPFIPIAPFRNSWSSHFTLYTNWVDLGPFNVSLHLL